MTENNDHRIAGGKPLPRDLDFFKKMTSCGSRGGKALYKDADGFYYQWDSYHNEQSIR